MNPYLISEDDVVLNFKELFRYLGKRWISILVVGILFACLMGGYYITDFKKEAVAIRTENPEEESEAQEADLVYEAQSEAYANSIDILGENVKQHNEYLKNSTLMKIDPYNVPTAQASIILTTSVKDKSIGAIISDELRYELLEGEYLGQLAESTDVKSVPYLRELLKVTVQPLTKNGAINFIGDSGSGSSADAEVENDAQNISDEDSEKKTHFQISVVTIGASLEQANAILDGVLDDAKQYCKKRQDTYKFSEEVNERKSYTTQSVDVINSQHQFYNNMNWTIEKKAGAENSQKVLQKPTVSGGSSEVNPSIDKKKMVKYAGAGFALGFILMILFYFIKYITNNRVISYKDLCNRFVLKNLGEYEAGTTTSSDMIAANILNYAAGASQIVLMGTVDRIVLEELQSSLQKSMSVDITVGGNMLVDPSSRRKLAESDIVVLVEKKKTSKYSDLRDETEIVSNAGKQIAGIVIC